jgi:penicillin-binding protein 1C
LDIRADQSRQNEIAWKTGTSWAFRDAWAAGVSGPYVLVVWVGNFDGRGNDAFVGRYAAGPLMFSIFDSVYPGQGWKVSDTVSTQNLNLKRLLICSASGDLYEKDCPSSQKAWFIPGVSPIKVSDIYRKIPINKKSGLRACWHKEGVSELKVFEFWPSDFLHIYNQAGISLKTPPQYESDCDMDLKSTTGQMPVITSPQSTIEYMVRESKDDNLIPFKAIVDPDVTKVHWFVDDVYAGSTKGKEALLWKGRPGRFMVRAVDDYGRAAVKQFVVNSLK